MGCGQSKIENEEPLTRCRDRKQFMKEAVTHRNAFAAAHSGYTVHLKNTGAALSDYGEGEVQHMIPPSSSSASSIHHHHHSASAPSSSSSIPSSSTSTSTIVQPPIDTPLPPPPPPLPDYQPAPLQRAASMPEFAIPKKHTSKAPADSAIQEDDEDDGDADDEGDASLHRKEHRRRNSKNSNNINEEDVRPAQGPPVSPPPPRILEQVVHSAEGKAVGPGWFGEYIFDTQNFPGHSLSQPDPEEFITPPVTPAQEILAQEKVVVEPHPPPPPDPPAAVQDQHQHQAPPPAKPVKKLKGAAAIGESKRARMETHPVTSVNLLQVLNELDDHFLKASESAHDVSKMLEATRMHYHSNFADNRGHIDHSARLMRVITWNRSCKGMKEEDDGKDDFDNEELETHATILDKMLAWEKKLYDEVKAGELMKTEYQRKVAQLTKQKKRGASPETLEKTKAALSHLHTRYIVDMQSMDSTVSEINRLRDKQLYPKLVDLVSGMAKMWETMHMHHNSQLKISLNLKNLDVSIAPNETSKEHHDRTVQLWHVLRDWRTQFQKLMSSQKLYIEALNCWLKLNLIPIESNLKEKLSSPSRVQQPEIQPLLLAWQDQLEKLPDDLVGSAILGFSEVVHTIVIIQEDELGLKHKCEETRREYMRKSRAFEDWLERYLEKKAAAEAAAAAAAEEGAAAAQAGSGEAAEEAANQEDEVIAERRAVVESLKARQREDDESYRRICKQVREKSVGSLRTHLPELFRALSDFSFQCSRMYKKLMSIITQSQDTEVPS